VDEVLAVGDTEFQRKCVRKMENVGREGKAILVVSHNLHLITTLCSSAMLLDQGEVRSIGSCQSVIGDYERTLSKSRSRDGVRNVRHSDGKSSPIIKWVKILNDKGERCTVFENGEYIHLVVSLDDKLPEATYLEWLLLTEKRETATSGGTFMVPGFRLPTPSGKLHIKIGPVSLAQGQYTLVLRAGVLPGYVLDEWCDVETLIVSKCLVNGLPFDSRRGIALLPATYDDASDQEL
jgi:lipopolysaccharide transport system ATP-binding protein